MKQFIIAFITLIIAGVGESTAQRLINVKGRVMQTVTKMVDGKKEKVTQTCEYVHVYGVPDRQAADYVVQQFNDWS